MSATVVCGTPLEPTPLEPWTAARLGPPAGALTREAIERWQLARLNETIAWTRERSPFYRERLAGSASASLTNLADLCSLPFTTGADLALAPERFLCVSQSEVRRVVTFSTSGTVGKKRVFFTAEDLDCSADYFEHGVRAVAARGERMAIALPCERANSVGWQLAKGIERAGVVPIRCGLATDPGPLLDAIDREQPAAGIGLPTQMLALAYRADAERSAAFRNLRSMVLCSDHVPSSLVEAIRRRSGCAVFEHYGMTETGLGGGIDCEAHAGYHFREADLYVEILDPLTGAPMPDGCEGEIVLTTLSRRAMPLLRYRTGDLSRPMPGPCPCGSVLKRLARVRDRIGSSVALSASGSLTLSMLDEALFALPGVTDFTASIQSGKPSRLELVFSIARGCASPNEAAIHDALNMIEIVQAATRAGELAVSTTATCQPLEHPTPKRRIEVR
ncbi:MAG TPA: AMP-binding protein [Terracidiphilus sp.]|nr:AMP-binding protein [Terracidiphilus sp.]